MLEDAHYLQNGDDALASTSGHVMVGLIGADGEPDPPPCGLLPLRMLQALFKMLLLLLLPASCLGRYLERWLEPRAA